jgi:hypothetical protein
METPHESRRTALSAEYRRIDYIDVSGDAAVIDGEVSAAQRERRYVEASYSAVLNRIVTRRKAENARDGPVEQ